MAATKLSWPDQIHRLLRAQRVRQVAYVPDFGHSRLIDLVRSDRQMRAVPLTTEEEGVALVTGAWLGGERSVLLMQSSGAGNCINMLGVIQECRIPLLMLVTMRGQWGEFNPWQVPMAQATAPALAAVGGVVQPGGRAAGGAGTRRAAAAILGQRGDALVVAGLGAPCWDTAAAGDHPLNFYTWGGMGSAAMIGRGVALAA